jgi:hypothetical protein
MLSFVQTGQKTQIVFVAHYAYHIKAIPIFDFINNIIMKNNNRSFVKSDRLRKMYHRLKSHLNNTFCIV